TDSLLKHALFVAHDEVRQAAIAVLKDRSLFSYVPTAMGALRSPIEVQFDQYALPGMMKHRLSLYEEGPLADNSSASLNGAVMQVWNTIHPIDRYVDTQIKVLPDSTLPRDLVRAEQAVRENERRQQLNQRISAMLKATTGNQLADQPSQWWDWWYDYNEMYR